MNMMAGIEDDKDEKTYYERAAFSCALKASAQLTHQGGAKHCKPQYEKRDLPQVGEELAGGVVYCDRKHYRDQFGD